jgi:hypothetical protein
MAPANPADNRNKNSTKVGQSVSTRLSFLTLAFFYFGGLFQLKFEP